MSKYLKIKDRFKDRIEGLSAAQVRKRSKQSPWLFQWNPESAQPEQSEPVVAFANASEWMQSLKTHPVQYVDKQTALARRELCLQCKHNKPTEKIGILDIMLFAKHGRHIKLGSCAHFNHENNAATCLDYELTGNILPTKDKPDCPCWVK